MAAAWVTTSVPIKYSSGRSYVLNPARPACNQPVPEEQNQRSQHGHEEAGWVVRTVPTHGPPEEPAHNGAHDAQEDGDNKATRIPNDPADNPHARLLLGEGEQGLCRPLRTPSTCRISRPVSYFAETPARSRVPETESKSMSSKADAVLSASIVFEALRLHPDGSYREFSHRYTSAVM